MRFSLRHLSRRETLRTAGALLAVLCFPASPLRAVGPVPGTAAVFADGPAEPAPLAAQSLLLGVARAGDALVAVGDRGHILVSTDHGATWTQRPSPTRVMLTAVAFPDATHGWAVGHEGVILATTDGGATWARQNAPTDRDTVLFHVHFADAKRGWAVGAYGKFFATGDAGGTWLAAKPSDDEVHFNHLGAGPDGTLWLAGETGTLLRSDDDGRTWTPANVPYDGSLFGTLATGPDQLVAFGLRGHVFQTRDRGATWLPVATGSTALVMGGVRLRNGVVVLAGQGGQGFVSHDRGATFAAWKPEGVGGSVAALAEAADGALIAVGENGVRRLLPPAAEAP